MKIIAAYALLTGTMAGLLPKNAVASTFKPLVSVQYLNMGNGRPDPESRKVHFWGGPAGQG